MDHADALRTLQLLTDGKDPMTGLPLPDISPYNQPQVLRSLFAAIRALEMAALTDRLPVGLGDSSAKASPSAIAGQAAVSSIERSPPRVAPANAGKPWNSVEDDALCSAFEHGLDAKALAAKHGRSRTAVNARLFKLGKISDPGIPLRQPIAAKRPKREASHAAP